ncbi:MAG TPA: twin-arginine translocation signal domain-containing protein, partial [Candidatus Limnocylindrales bacterium]
MTDRSTDLAAPPSLPLLTRRDVLRAAALGGLAAFLAACGSGPSPSGSTVPPAGSGSPAPSLPPSAGPSATPVPSAVPSSSAAGSPAPSSSGSPDAALRRQIAGLLVVGFRGATLDAAPWLRTALRDDGLGGVILFDRDQLTGKARNVTSPAQVKRLTASLRAAAGSRGIVIAVDQEGGVVTRL